ncbi:ATP-binding protein [Streptomyces violens]|uniref:ATP-binding protein n=1 Tax=Streptomyces violens TaxID=66377 RepID=UPI0004C236A0|nr:AAA family ATPase [Streptomyces violens]
MLGSESCDRVVLAGRDEALTEVEDLLRHRRLVTVTGPGGIGKSALAGALARRPGLGPDAVVARTDLAPLIDPGLVPHWLARALGMDGPAGKPQLAALTEALGDTPALLVVDTCEHLATRCTEVLTALVDACPRLHVLATSRTPLRTPGLYPLSPVPLDVAAELFTEYARQLDAEEPPPDTVRRICALLDGLPLAVRIAADRLAHRSAADVLSSLTRAEAALDLPATAPGLPTRQRSLRDSLDWSLRLCTAEERLLWARLSVFPGSFELAQVLEICGDAALPPGPLVAAFTGLAWQSLIEPQPDDNEGTAFRMPRTTRAYGRQRLSLSGEERELLNRFLAWTLRAS